jgi:hypothetical protein
MIAEELRELAPEIDTFNPVDSAETPVCRPADRLAGMAEYSCDRATVMTALSDEERSGKSVRASGQRSCILQGIRIDTG